jgi:hypothetical protein
MKYLCLGYLDVKAFDSLPEAEKDEVMRDCPVHCETLRATGKVIVEAGLANTRTARSIRPRNGRPGVSDGPFVETKEQLGGFFIIEAASIDEAVQIASKHPAALVGEKYGFGIEVRAIEHEVIFPKG